MKEVRSLVEVLAEVPDHRDTSGRRYSLLSVLLLLCVATMCGYKSYGAMAKWGEDYGEEWVKKLGFASGKTPSVGTLHWVLSRMDVSVLEEKLSQWAFEVLEALSDARARGASLPGPAPSIAIDGKTLRSSSKQGAPGAHVLAALVPALGLTLFQTGVPHKTNEIGAVRDRRRARSIGSFGAPGARGDRRCASHST